ncbi:DNA polymerase IV [Tissierella sp. MSJ-40]|uniref:DNA polymerase IV n=1 Tax=Tissierella simiarum TaxID=2841534 RepID=A0ABS6EAU4_9FIRM|nr:DNA polymerase IV [Tissierella simiarum]MBU5440041.1 DNA polymerase IV [Tissierella simiarum]
MSQRTIIHMDMDAFFASIEQRDNANLRGKPVIVGGAQYSRGVVATASYEARTYGIHSAMPISKAKQLCPKGIFLPVNMKKYKEVSKEIHDILEKYSNIIEPISIDEAFIDINNRDPIFIGRKIKDDIWQELRLTSSIGISVNKFLAKLASDVNKPNGFTIIKEEEKLKFLCPLPVSKIWGVGPKTKKELNRLGIYTIGDIQSYDEKVLINLFGKRGKEIFEFANGVDNRPVESQNMSQSLGEEETFEEDIDDIDLLLKKLAEYSFNLSQKLKLNGYLIKTITVKVKYYDFSIETRTISLTIPTNDSSIIFETSKYILTSKFKLSKKIRLIGLSISNFIYPKDPIQLSINL